MTHRTFVLLKVLMVVVLVSLGMALVSPRSSFNAAVAPKVILLYAVCQHQPDWWQCSWNT